MNSRDFLVQPGSALLADGAAIVLYRYPSGEVLLRTTTPTQEPPVEQGVRLGADLSANLDGARAGFEALDPSTPGAMLAYVEMVGPIARAWLRRLEELAVTPLRFQPANSYLCRATAAALKEAAEETFVLRVTPLIPQLKPSPNVGQGADVWIVGQCADDAREALLSTLRATGGVEIAAALPAEDVDHFIHVPARVTPAGAEAVRKLDAVLAIEERKSPQPEDELANLIIAGQYDRSGKPSGNYLRWLDDHGVSGLGVAIGIVDAGVDTTHVAFAGRIKDLTGGSLDWHGTFVAGHAAGAYLDERDDRGFIYGVGVAPRADILVQSNQRGAGDLCRETVSAAGPSGARGAVQNNSWGTGLATDPASMNYGALEAAYDSLVRNADPGGATPRPLAICFSTGNSGNKGLTRPKAAKNIIVTGNSENLRPEVGHEDSDNIDEVYGGPHPSSWGNCGDGRIRPDVVAPGEWTASANYDSHPGEKEYISPKLTWGGGSSAASPKTAGACALLIQWWRRHGKDPSPALLRALVVNGAEPLSYREPIPNRYEGWGRLNLANVLDGQVSRVYEDQSVLLRERGEKKEWLVRVVDPKRPVKITLSWTDPPGAVGSGDRPENSAIVNSLVLRAFAGSLAYRGNNFQNGWCVSAEVPNAQAEGADNLQNIFLPAGVVDGAFRVVVEARNIAANCRDPKSPDPQQDFALVITNACLDEARASTEVFLGVDSQANGPPARDADDHWQPGTNNDDRAELGGGPPGPSAARPVARTTRKDEDAWWDSGDSLVRREAVMASAAVAVPSVFAGEASAPTQAVRRLAEAAARAVDLMTSRDVGRVTLAARAMPEGGESKPLVELAGASGAAAVARAALEQNQTTPLTTALSRLAERWSKTGLERRAAVFVVGRGTRVTADDLVQMRRIALLGQLYLISDNPSILAFLAQRLGRLQGLALRLASDADSVPALVRDTMAEASGGRPLVVVMSAGAPPAGGGAATYRFEVVPADRRIAISIAFPGAVPQLRIRRPGRPDFETLEPAGPAGAPAVSLFAPASGLDNTEVTLRVSDSLATLTIAPKRGDFWAGPWDVEVSQLAPAGGLPDVHVWAWGDLQLRVETRDLALHNGGRHAESGGRADPEDRLVLVGSGGASFRSVEVEKKKVGPETEAERIVAVAPARSRLDKVDVGLPVGVAPEDERPPLLASALAVVPPARPRAQSDGAQLTDLLLTATGVDASGNTFRRRVPVNVVTLEPRGVWRERIAAAAAQFVALTNARIAEVEYGAESGDIAALVLEKNRKRRTVSVASANLQKALQRIDLGATNLVFQVRDSELYAVVAVLAEMRPASDEPGIEGPIPEPPKPKQEASNTDYPDASRFVAAQFFKTSNSSRSIRRVVVHITDGSARIDGTISWFQNPTNADGTQSKVSAHYVVGQDGEVVQMVRDNDVAYHAGSANEDSIGIEHVARSPGAFNAGDPGLSPTPTEYAASAALVRWLCDEYAIPMDRDHIVGHAEADSGTSHAGCPNAVWDWAYYMNLVASGESHDSSDGP